MATGTQRQPFAQCSMCKYEWKDRDSFLYDNSLSLNGYQADLDNLENGWFLFTHITDECGSTIALKAGLFFDLYDGPVYERKKTGTKECPGYCLNESILHPCPSKCKCGFVRDILTIIEDMKKNNQVGV